MVANQVFKDDPASTLALSHHDWSALGLDHDAKREEVEESTSSMSWITALREVRERSREKKRLLVMSVFLEDWKGNRFSMKKNSFQTSCCEGRRRDLPFLP